MENDVLDLLIYEPVEFMESVKAYLCEKYGEEFGILKMRTNSYQLDNVVTAYSCENESSFFKVKCKCCKDKKYHFYDNYMSVKIARTVTEKLKALAEALGMETVKCYLQAWYSTEYGDKDSRTDFDEREQLDIAGRHGGLWHIYIEHDGSDEQIEAAKSRLAESIENEGLYGTYYIYFVEPDSLMLMDEENYINYLPKSRAADGEICKACIKTLIRKDDE